MLRRFQQLAKVVCKMTSLHISSLLRVKECSVFTFEKMYVFRRISFETTPDKIVAILKKYFRESQRLILNAHFPLSWPSG